MHRPVFRFVPLLALTLVASCGSDSTPTAPTTPTPTTVTETFSGTINVNGAATHTFTAQSFGTVNAGLTSLGPDSSVVVGFALGTWNGLACQLVLTKDDATQTTVLTGALSTAGSLCVRIYDVGKMTEPVSYEIQVVHP